MVNLLLSNDFISKNKITNTLKCAVEGRKKAMTAKKQECKRKIKKVKNQVNLQNIIYSTHPIPDSNQMDMLLKIHQ